VAVAVTERLGVPVLFVGIGEELDALAPFDPGGFVEWLLT
jgi:signal recognition particle GTPase